MKKDSEVDADVPAIGHRLLTLREAAVVLCLCNRTRIAANDIQKRGPLDFRLSFAVIAEGGSTPVLLPPNLPGAHPVLAVSSFHEQLRSHTSQGVRKNRPSLHALSHQPVRWNGTSARSRLQKPRLWLLRIDIPKADLRNRALPKLC